jgi:hypothetical protein
MKKKMKMIFITRTKSKRDFEDGNFRDLIKEVSLSGINDIYVISNTDVNDCEIDSVKIRVINDDDPTSPTSINKVLDVIKNEKGGLFILICSKEVRLRRRNIEKLKKVMVENSNNLLVAGFKFEIENDEQLKNELENYYNDKNSIAYQVPWNTCAIWNYQLFKEYVGKFDEITNKNPFGQVCVCIDNVCCKTDHQGMEDGLAIAKASSQKHHVYYRLLDKKLPWKVKSSDKQQHRKKLARKDTVMRNFMGVRDYSVKDLEDSEM